MNNEELIEWFHRLWDEFPGMARLIDRNHQILASNPKAQAKGFQQGLNCASVGDPSLHADCKLQTMFDAESAITDNVLEDRIRGWIPVVGYENVYVHFALMLD